MSKSRKVRTVSGLVQEASGAVSLELVLVLILLSAFCAGVVVASALAVSRVQSATEVGGMNDDAEDLLDRLESAILASQYISPAPEVQGGVLLSGDFDGEPGSTDDGSSDSGLETLLIARLGESSSRLVAQSTEAGVVTGTRVLSALMNNKVEAPFLVEVNIDDRFVPLEEAVRSRSLSPDAGLAIESLRISVNLTKKGYSGDYFREIKPEKLILLTSD